MSSKVLDIERLFAEGIAIDAAVRRAGHEAVLEHIREGLPIAIWKDDRVIWISAEELRSSAVAPLRGPVEG